MSQTAPEMRPSPQMVTVYSNLARIAHSPADFVIDFAHWLPGEAQAWIQARILLSPLSAKLLLRALTENLARYEAAFGEISIPGDGPSLADLLFRPSPDDNP